MALTSHGSTNSGATAYAQTSGPHFLWQLTDPVLFGPNGATLTITVVSSADSRPIPNAIVRVQLSNDQVMQGDAFVERRTNDAGQARFVGLYPVGNHAVWA